jgi:tight adherence protein C
MGFAVTAFLVIFVLIASGGLLLFYREAMLQRITDVINPSAKKKGLIGQIQDSGFSVGSLVEHFNSVIPKSQAEVSVVKARLIRAGYRTERSIKMFNGAKFLTPLAICAVAWATGLYKLSPFFVYACGLGLGFLLPDFWLGNRIKKRQSLIRKGLPDVLDLLVI